MQATLFGSPLGGACQFVSGGIQNIGWNRLKEAGRIVFFGFSRRETAFHPALLKGVRHRLMNGTIGGQGAGGGERVICRQDKGVGQISAVLDQTSTCVTTDKRAIRWGDRGFLEVSDRDAWHFPFVDSQEWSLDVTKEGLIDRHVFWGGRLFVKKKTRFHRVRISSK